MRLFSFALALALLAPSAASAQQFFDFDGQATGYTTVGDVVTMVAVVGDPGVDTPLPLDFASFQYTIVVESLDVDLISGNTTGLVTGTIALYEDDGTPADFADASTFTDGTALLTGEVESLAITQFTATLGSGSGLVDWTGGSRISDFRPSDRENWAFVVNTSPATASGYDHRWDGKVEPQEPVVDTEVRSWGGVKIGY
ncbi:MAG TPA: hypothetical protein VKA86_14035 [Candidatus Krumholzibacteria bacterium]|nr:hypothetical protein [Candidatus Krumholzibacteria bacterium]